MKKLFSALLALLTVYAAAAQCNLSFNTSISANNSMEVLLTNTSTWNLVAGSTPQVWITWGDTLSSPPRTYIQYNATTTAGHIYQSPGTYTVTLHTYYRDTNTNQLICSTSTQNTVTVNFAPCTASISKTDNGNGVYTFSVNNLGGGSNNTYSWNFGDGTPPASGASVTHTYLNSGNYTITLTSTAAGCSHISNSFISYFNGTVDCSNLHANFNSSATYALDVDFTNTSTWVTIPGGLLKLEASWNFGDGTTASGNNVTKTYTSAGTYSITMINKWKDSIANNIVYCTDTITKQVIVTARPPQPSIISGSVSWDTFNIQGLIPIKVWLIVHDSGANTLTAIDSSVVSGSESARFSFSDHPSDNYLVKAAPLSGIPGTAGLVPTYYEKSLYWHTAKVINHNGKTTDNIYIRMREGIVTSGPGFIGGNISYGAGKGTSTGVPDLLIILQDGTGGLIHFTYTNANGDYSFDNLPEGTYSIYPEAINYTTTPYLINLSSGQYVANGINFKKTGSEIKPISTSVGSLPEAKLFHVYPNPSDGQIQINWINNNPDKVRVQVTDIIGRKVLILETHMNQPTTLNLSQFNAGVYFISVSTDKAYYHTERIILK